MVHWRLVLWQSWAARQLSNRGRWWHRAGTAHATTSRSGQDGCLRNGDVPQCPRQGHLIPDRGHATCHCWSRWWVCNLWVHAARLHSLLHAGLHVGLHAGLNAHARLRPHGVKFAIMHNVISHEEDFRGLAARLQEHSSTKASQQTLLHEEDDAGYV